tara:strand:+ start:1514 stop:1804 length:291 start_codon:yes stop_codon:yes gene_type:complete
MGFKKPIRKTNYKIGDLVRLNDDGILFELTETTVEMGIIASEAYVFMKTSCESTSLDDVAMMQLEDWCYDIFLGDRLVEMIPEIFLEEVFVIKEEE